MTVVDAEVVHSPALIAVAGPKDDHFDTDITAHRAVAVFPRLVFQCSLHKSSGFVQRFVLLRGACTVAAQQELVVDDDVAGVLEHLGVHRAVAREAMALAETDPKAAEAKYREALALVPTEDSLKICLAQVVLKQGRLEECGTILDALAARGFLEPEAERLKSELEVRLAAAESGGVDEARKAADAEPGNLLLRIRLADAYAAVSQHRKALEICLEIVKQDFGEARNEAKTTMVKIFDMLGPASELTGEFRRQLATALY